MAKLGKAASILVGILAVAVLALWATSPDPKFNPASFEQEPLDMTLASLEEAVTLAQIMGANAQPQTLMVTDFAGDTIGAVNISQATGEQSFDPFVVLAALSEEKLASLSELQGLERTYSIVDLLPAAPAGDRHIGTGTNFPEHADEASSPSVFMFPKFGMATPARTQVAARDDVLLDYEIELCMRFDRPIASIEDFDAATKGVFLCGDFTDRAKLTRMVDPDNLDSGSGFSDAKSRADFYPSGPFLVIPLDWSGFVATERFMTFVNEQPRQDARGGEMTLDFRDLTAKALGEMGHARFLYADEFFELTPEPQIAAEMSLMSGTAEGVIFAGPTRGDIIEGTVKWLFSARWARGEGLIPTVIEAFLENEFESEHFLQPGDVVAYRSSRLGDIRIEVVE